MPDLTRRLLLQLSLAGVALPYGPEPIAPASLQSLWLQRSQLLRQRDQAVASVFDSELGDALWALFGELLEDIERQIFQLPADPDTIAAWLLIDYENYSLGTATEIGSPRDSLRRIADAYLRVYKPILSGFIFGSS